MKTSKNSLIATITFLIIFLAALANSSYGLSFDPWVAYQAGNGPIAVTSEDFDGDGELDFAVANSGDNNISIRLGVGDGTFGPAVEFAAGSYPFSITSGDFNGDGKPDLAVSNAGGNDISVILGKGDGSFDSPVNYSVGGDPYSVVTGDFNGDGKVDLAVACFNGNGVFVLLGIGNGTFSDAVGYTTGGSPQEVAVADFNGDGKSDLVVAKSNSNDLSVLLGNGDGTFQTAVPYTVGIYQNAVNAGDLNGDGRPDIAVANGNDKLSILLGNGDGTFQTPVHYTVGQRPESVAFADFDGDGRIDIATANMNSHSVSILLGNGDGTFQTAMDQALGGNIWASSIALGDLNGDGTIDLIVGSDGGNNVAVLLNSTPVYPLIRPQAGTIGTEIEFADPDLGNRKGKIYLRANGKNYNLKVFTWNENGNGLAVAVLTKALSPGMYDVVAQPKEPKGAPAIIAYDAFTVAGPDITEIAPSLGAEGDVVTITGELFGTKKPKVFIEYINGTNPKRKSCKVMSWPLTSQSGTGTGEIKITIPRGVPEGQWNLAVENKVGRDTAVFEYREDK